MAVPASKRTLPLTPFTRALVRAIIEDELKLDVRDAVCPPLRLKMRRVYIDRRTRVLRELFGRANPPGRTVYLVPTLIVTVPRDSGGGGNNNTGGHGYDVSPSLPPSPSSSSLSSSFDDHGPTAVGGDEDEDEDADDGGVGDGDSHSRWLECVLALQGRHPRPYWEQWEQYPPLGPDGDDGAAALLAVEFQQEVEIPKGASREDDQTDHEEGAKVSKPRTGKRGGRGGKKIRKKRPALQNRQQQQRADENAADESPRWKLRRQWFCPLEMEVPGVGRVKLRGSRVSEF